eukprot:TRINITY_DN64175_c0_g1_i1.p1 TRINITY_DN64175_c0_g1~~TRINITY_DN64175_c0_g1_i1.p1  ORF type:complete len:453 (+),score=62.57 TRINITY_DN64175_c0_g1_i1:74-1432(+)
MSDSSSTYAALQVLRDVETESLERKPGCRPTDSSSGEEHAPASSCLARACSTVGRVACITAVACLFVACMLYFSMAMVLAKQAVRPEARINDARIPPPAYPREMACGNCGAGNKSDDEINRCTEPCFGLDYVLEWERLAAQLDYAAVHFTSREGPRGEAPVRLQGWWLAPAKVPAQKKGLAPRIVVMHGRGGNANDCSVQSTCFLLRSMGFGCLTPNARDAGTSGSSSHPKQLTAGYDYAMDVLGAWDYARRDPHGILGGALPASKVGIMGPQAVAIAFALERRIAGAWFDSALVQGVEHLIDTRYKYLSFLEPLLTYPIKVFARELAQPLDYYKPLEMLKNCSTEVRRKIGISHSSLDDLYPVEEANTAVDVLTGLPSCYEVDVFIPPANCDGVTHRTATLQYPDDMRNKLCRFWNYVFGDYDNHCDLSRAPPLEENSPEHFWRSTIEPDV